MKTQSSNQVLECQVCYPKSQEVIHLMYNLQFLVFNQCKKQLESKSQTPDDLQDKNDGAVQKLIRFIFNEKLATGILCKHAIVEKFLLSKTNMSIKKINEACDTIYQFQAKRNYQIQVLVSQVKCFPKTIIDNIMKKTKQTSQKQKKEQPLIKQQQNDIVSQQRKESNFLEPQQQNQIISPQVIPYYYYPCYIPTNTYPQYYGPPSSH